MGEHRSMALHIDPRHPVLWRSPTSLQLGLATGVVLDDVDRPVERLVAALVAGVSPSGFEMLARDGGVDPDAFLDRVRPALAAPPAPGERIVVSGGHPLAAELASQLAAQLDAAPGDRPDLVVLVADHVVAPDDQGRWLRRDVPHLPVVVGAERVEIGPRVEPGSSACLHCDYRSRCDDDPAWPALATQLSRLPAAALPRSALAAAAVAAVDLIASGATGARWTFDLVSRTVSAREVLRHPACLCAAPPGSDWALAPDHALPPAPRTARSVAARA